MLNVSFLINDLKINFGGTAGNIAYSLSLLGERPIIISTAGKDFERYRKWMERNNLDFSQVKIVEDKFTAVAHIVTDRSDNQITAFYPGSMEDSGGEIKKELLKDSIAIVAPGCQKDMVDYPEIYKKNNVPYIFDPGQQITALSKEELRNGIEGAKVFISNDYELSLVSQKTGWSEDDIISRVEIVVTTLGEKGSKISTKDKKISIPPAKPESIKDPTGAGDAYRAGFISGFAKNYPLEKAGRLGSVVSAYSVETYGTQTHRFSWKEICERYKKNFGEEI